MKEFILSKILYHSFELFEFFKMAKIFNCLIMYQLVVKFFESLSF